MTDELPPTPVAAKVLQVATKQMALSWIKKVVNEVSMLETKAAKMWQSHEVAFIAVLCYGAGLLTHWVV